MSFSQKDIVIYPRRGDAEYDPSIRFTGANNDTATYLWLFTYPLANGTVAFEGSAGSIFSVTNQTVGTIFSVNDISGLPIMSVDSLGTVTIQGDLVVNGSSTYNILTLTNIAYNAANSSVADYVGPISNTTNIAYNIATASFNVANAASANTMNLSRDLSNTRNIAIAAYTQANSGGGGGGGGGAGISYIGETPHRYWKVKFKNDNGWIALSDFFLETTLGGGWANGGTYSYSSTPAGFTAWADNNLATNYGSGYTSNTLVTFPIDFGTAVVVSNIRLVPKSDWAVADQASFIGLEYSDDNITYTTVREIYTSADLAWASSSETKNIAVPTGAATYYNFQDNPANSANYVLIINATSNAIALIPQSSISGNGGAGGVPEAFDTANTAKEIAIAAFDTANAAGGGTIQEAYDKANSANIIASAAFDAANSGASIGAPFDRANNAQTISIAAFDKANGAIANTNNVIIYGDLRVTGTLNVGNSTTTITTNSIDANNITVATSLIVNSVDIVPALNAAFAKANTGNGGGGGGGSGTANSANIFTVNVGVHQLFQTKTAATGIIAHDCSLGQVFYHTTPSSNWTVNFTNMNLNSSYATTIDIVISQGLVGYYPSAMQINGVDQSFKWEGSTEPVPSSNTDIARFNILNVSGTYTVLGSYKRFDYDVGPAPDPVLTDLVYFIDAANTSSYSGSGSSLNDLSGSGLGSSTLYSTPTYTSAGLGSYFTFDGSSQYILTPNLKTKFNSPLTDNVTLEVWIYVPSDKGVVLAELGSGATNTGWHLTNMEVGNSDRILGRFWNMGTKPVAGVMNRSNWNQAVLTYNGTILRTYLNGVAGGTTTESRLTPYGNGNDYYIGLMTSDFTYVEDGSYLAGRWSIFRVYNRALTASEVLQNFKSAKGRYGI